MGEGNKIKTISKCVLLERVFSCKLARCKGMFCYTTAFNVLIFTQFAKKDQQKHMAYLDGSLGLDGRNGSVDVLWYNVTAVQHAASHVLAVTWVALYHLIGWLEASVRDLSD